MNFKEFFENESPAEQWQKMRQQVQGLGDSGSTQKRELPNQITDLLKSGFQMGGIVPKSVMDALDLNGKNKHLIADSLLLTKKLGRFIYPFYKEKQNNAPTGRILFVAGFPINDLKNMMS